MLTDLSLDKEELKAIVRKKQLGLAGMSTEAMVAMEQFQMSVRRAGKLVYMDRSSYRYLRGPGS